MRRLLPVLLAPLLFALSAPAAPVPKHLMKDRKPAYYFPTTVGAKWEYDSRTVSVAAVDDSKDVRGAKVVTVCDASPNGRGAIDEVMEVSETGLRRIGFGGDPFDVPLPMLQGPFEVGTKWEIKTKGAEGIGEITAFEVIEVPAGKFEAVRVDLVQKKQGRTIRAWYAPGVGLLKMTENDRTIWLLKSFTPGKE